MKFAAEDKLLRFCIGHFNNKCTNKIRKEEEKC